MTIRESGFDGASTGYSNNRTTILAADIAAAADLAAAFQNNPSAAFWYNFSGRQAALDKHLNGIDAYLTANDTRVHPALRDYLNWTLSPANVFQSPALSGSTRMATFTLTGAGAGTFVDGQAVDTTKFGKVWLEIEVTQQTVSADITITVIGSKIDTTAQSKSVLVPGGSTVGTKVNLGTLGTSADHYVDVTNITVTGGGASDKLYVNSRLERTIAL